MKINAGAASRLRTLHNAKESSLTQTEHPSTMPTSWRCLSRRSNAAKADLGQLKDVVGSYSLSTPGSLSVKGCDRSSYVARQCFVNLPSCKAQVGVLFDLLQPRMHRGFGQWLFVGRFRPASQFLIARKLTPSFVANACCVRLMRVRASISCKANDLSPE
jgi:hypothetical protein